MQARANAGRLSRASAYTIRPSGHARRTAARAASMLPMIPRACRRNTAPASDRQMPFGVRTSSDARSSSSSLRIWRLTAGWATCSFSAARPTWPSSATATKYSIWARLKPRIVPQDRNGIGRRAVVRDGARLGDVGATIEELAIEEGCSVVREFGGHGIGRRMHMAPHVSHFGTRGAGFRLRAGMVFTVEPMINLGSADARVMDDERRMDHSRRSSSTPSSSRGRGSRS
jgi:hypothetical protein